MLGSALLRGAKRRVGRQLESGLGCTWISFRQINMSHEDISSSSEIQVLLLNGIVTDNDGVYSLVGKRRFESCLTVKCRIFLVSPPRPCPIRSGWPPSPMTAAKSTPLSLSHALHAHRSRTRRGNRHSFDSPATNQPSELRASEIAARSDSLYTRGIKGPPPSRSRS